MGASNLKLILISSTWDCTTFHNSFSIKKQEKSSQDCDWLAKWLFDVGIYGSKMAEGFRRSSVGLVDSVYRLTLNKYHLTDLQI